MAKDKARAILSYATPNPVGPYRLITPPAPVGPSKTKTPILPVVGGSLINVPLPQMPSKTSNAPAQDVGQRKQINVPTPPMAEKLKASDDIEGRLDPMFIATRKLAELEQRYVRTHGPGYQDNPYFKKEAIPFYNAVRSGIEREVQTNPNSPLAQEYERLRDRMYGYSWYGGRREDDNKSIESALILAKRIQEMRGIGMSAEDAVDVVDLGTLGAAYREQYRGNPAMQGYVSNKRAVANDYASLNKAERETYKVLIRDWSGTPKELLETVKSLSK